MAIEFVGAAKAAKIGTTSGNSTIPLASGLTGGIAGSVSEGDLVIAVFATGSTANRTLSITTGYTLIDSELYADDSKDTNLRVMYKFMGSTPDTVTTFGPTGSASDAGAMVVYVFRGVDATTPLDVAAVSATGINSPLANPPSITPVTAGAFIVCAGGAGHAENVDTFASSDLTQMFTIGINDSNDATVGVAHKNDWSSGAFDPAQWTFTGGALTTYSWAAMTIALRPAADSGSVGESDGSATASATGAAQATSSASSVGEATVSATGAALSAAVGTSAGVSTAAAVGDFNSGSEETATATADGQAAVSGVGASQAQATASSVAEATISGIAISLASAVGTSTGEATASAESEYLFASIGISAGEAVVAAFGLSQAAAIGSAAGTSTALGVAISDAPLGDYILYRRRRR